MDLKFRKPEEVVALLCERLRKERLYLEITQADVAGIGVNTVSNLEAGRNVSFENWWCIKKYAEKKQIEF